MIKRLLLVGWLVAALGPPASGAIRFELPEVKTLTDGSGPATGSFDVLVRAGAADLPRQISSFNVDFHAGSASVFFGPPQAASTPLLTGAPQSFSSNAQTFRAALDVFPSSASLVDGVALVRVTYSVSAGVSGTFPLTFGQFNQLANSQATAIPILSTDVGAISIFYTADFTESGKVDAGDLAVWIAEFGRSAGAVHSHGDANGDGDVDGADFLTWQRQFAWGSATTSGAVAVPESTCGVLWMLGFAFIQRRFQKISPPHSLTCGLQPWDSSKPKCCLLL